MPLAVPQAEVGDAMVSEECLAENDGHQLLAHSRLHDSVPRWGPLGSKPVEVEPVEVASTSAVGGAGLPSASALPATYPQARCPSRRSPSWHAPRDHHAV